MSLMKTLAKVALGVAVAKGVSSMAKRGPTAGDKPGGGLLGGLDNLLNQAGGAITGGAQQARDVGGRMGGAIGGSGMSGRGGSGGGMPGGLGGALGQVLGGRGGSGLGGALESLRGASGRGGAGGGLDGLLGGLLGAGGAAAGGGLLGQLAGRAPKPSGQPEGDFGEVLNSQFDDDRPDMQPTPEQEAAAGLMLRAMIQAAKADGEIDENEREKLLGQLKDASPEEQRFVQEELRAPVDPEGLARQVPQGMEPQVYAMSLMAIDLDSREEAEHLHRLGTAMNLERDEMNAIHEKMGVPPLYRS